MTGGEPRQPLVCVGRVVGVRGVDGWVKIHSYTQVRSNIFDYGEWVLRHGRVDTRHELESGRELSRGLAARLRGIGDRDAASALVGAWIYVDRDKLPALAEGEYFWHQLEGLKVETLDGVALGTLEYLLETGANDVMAVAGDDRERLIPYVDEVVREIDLEAGLMRVDWDPGF